MRATPRFAQLLALLMTIFVLSACGGGSSGNGDPADTTETFALEGRVLNGVLVGSDVEVFGPAGDLLGTATTDADGRYIAEVSREGPYRLRATGGTLDGVDYTGTLESSCPAGSGCFVTPYTTVLQRLVDEHGFNHDDAQALMANSLDFDGDPFAQDVSAAEFDLGAAREAIAGGDGLAEWVGSIVAWATDPDAEPPPGIAEPEPAEPPVPPDAPEDPAPPPDPDPPPDPEPDPDPDPPVVPATYKVSATAGTGGSITPTSQTVEKGTTTTLEVTSNAGYRIDQVVGCDGTLDGTTYATGAITEACTVSATFALNEYTLSYSAGPNGSLTGTTNQTVSYGQDGTEVVAQPDVGSQFVQWSDGNASDARTDTNVRDNLNVTASFEAATYTVSFNANGGLAPTPASIEVTHGEPYGRLATTNRVGHNFQGWFTAPSGGSEVTSASTVTITAPQALHAQWDVIEYTVTAGSVTGGSLTPEQATVAHGDTTRFTLTVEPGFDIGNANLSGCGGSLAETTFTTGEITADCTITGSLDLNVYTLTYTADPNGSITGDASQSVKHGQSGTEVTAVPDTGYSFVEWSDSSSANPRTDSSVTGDLSVTANFGLNSYTVSATAGAGGSIDPASQTVDHGATASFTASPDTGYSIGTVSGCDGSLDGNTYTTGEITGACTVEASFALNTYTVSATAGTGGSISPASLDVSHGSETTFDVVPEDGYGVEAVTGCGGSLSGTTYTTGAITGPCTVSASFVVTLQPPTNVQAEPGDGTVILSWTDSPDAESYNVFWGTNPEIHPYTAASYDGFQSGVTSPHVVDGLTNGVEYFFAVTSVTGTAESLASTEVTATPGPRGEDIAIGGSFRGTITLGSGDEQTTLSSESPERIGLVAVFGPDGELRWAVKGTKPETDYGAGVSVSGIAMDPDGYVVATGWSHGDSATFVGTDGHGATLSDWQCYDSYDCFFLVRFDPEGRVVWASGADGDAGGHDVALTDDGYVMVTGSYSNDSSPEEGFWPGVTFGLGDNSVTLPASDYFTNTDVFLARYHADTGALDWAVHSADAGYDSGSAVDDWGYTAVTGYFEGRATFGTGEDAVTLEGEVYEDLFVATYRPDGRLLWANSATGSFVYGDDVVVDAGGNTLLVGSFSDTGAVTFTSLGPGTTVLEGLNYAGIFLARYGPMGILHWAMDIGEGYYSARVAADASGNALVASTDGKDLSLAQYRTDGSLDWAVSAQGTEWGTYSERLRVGDVQVASDGDVAVLGRFSGPLTFGSGDDSVTLDAETEDHAFVARYLSNGLLREAVQLEVAGDWSLGDAALRP